MVAEDHDDIFGVAGANASLWRGTVDVCLYKRKHSVQLQRVYLFQASISGRFGRPL